MRNKRAGTRGSAGELFRSLPLALLVLVGGLACKSDPPGVVNLHRLGLDREDHFLSGEPDLPEVGTEYFLAVTDLGTCLPCKKTAIWISRVWDPKRRPARLIFLDTLGNEFDRPATREFVTDKELRGTHYFCEASCVTALTARLGQLPEPPAYYLIGADGLVHWKGGYLPAYSRLFHAIRSGEHDLPLSMSTVPPPPQSP